METPRTVGIIGDPLEQTISPAIHNACYQRLELPFVYLPFHVKKEHLAPLVQCMRLMDVDGVNVTAPHKVSVAPLLDRLDPGAERIGAINTIVMRRGQAVGYNTDALGFLKALDKKLDLTPRGRTITIIGAGGAARAIADALLSKGAAAVTILNRTEQKAQMLARHLREHFPDATIQTAPWSIAQLRKSCAETDLIVQTTSAPRTSRGALRWPKSVKDPNLSIFDVRYGKGPNEFLDGALTNGLKGCDGFEMLIQQAALSFRLWTKTSPDLTVMRRAGRRALTAV